MRLNGIYVPVVTPFDDEGMVDFGAFEHVLDFIIEGGVHGIIPCGSTGEFYALNHDERMAVMRFVADFVGERVTLIAGTNAASTRDVIEYTRHAQTMGYQAVMLAPPYYSLPSQPELLAHYQAVMSSLDMPVVLYNFPARAGVSIEIGTVQRLAEHDNLAGIKESSGEFARLLALVNALEDRSLIVCGADDQAFDYFAWGVTSWIAGAASFLPAQHVALWRTATAGDLSEAHSNMASLMPLFVAMEGGKYIQMAKYGCALAGVPAGDPRPPLLPLDDDEKQAFEQVYAAASASVSQPRDAVTALR